MWKITKHLNNVDFHKWSVYKFGLLWHTFSHVKWYTTNEAIRNASVDLAVYRLATLKRSREHTSL